LTPFKFSVDERNPGGKKTYLKNMSPNKWSNPGAHKILVLTILPWIFLDTAFVSSSVQNEIQPSKQYSRLVECIQAANVEDPLIAFSVFEKEFDPSVHAANLAFFNEDSELISQIRTALNASELRWELENYKRRLLFVPETRAEYATLFKTYCKDVIDFILTQTQLQNPFRALQILDYENTEVPDTDNGITAFLVHNLAEEFVYSYSFYNSQKKKVVIELDQKVFIGEVGSYSSSIYQAADGTFVFVKNNYTIWQNSAKNPYSALMVPVEETFHISLRDYTQQAIRAELAANSVKSIDEVQRIVDEWVAVEEAIVGAMVFSLLPEFLRKSASNFQPAWIEEDFAVKHTLERYKYLGKGIEVVAELGVRNSLDLYRENPEAFRKLLIRDQSADSYL
jgi:hypothetical protein